jgi:multidrug transporter EmrE-like cation transporter
MIYLLLPSVFTIIVFVFLKYLQYKGKIAWFVVFLIILGLQIIFISYVIVRITMTNKIAEQEYYKIIDPTDENDGIFDYNNLTEEEKKVVDYYFQDAGRNVSSAILVVYYAINFIILSFISIIMDIIRKQKERILKHK